MGVLPKATLDGAVGAFQVPTTTRTGSMMTEVTELIKTEA